MARRDLSGRSNDPSSSRSTEVVYGLRAGLAVFATRRQDIVSVGYTALVRNEVSRLLRWAECEGVPRVEMSDERLARLAGSTLHEGLCLTVFSRRWTPPKDLTEHLLRTKGVALALDRVRNPYNIGAILRSAAFFGIDAVVLGSPAPHPGLPPDAVRVAEGGAEYLLLSRTTDLADTLGRLRGHGIQIVGADGRATMDARDFGFSRPGVLVLGHEREGLSDRVRKQCDALIAIRGTGTVESLNVGVAAGVLIYELVRGTPPRIAENAQGPTKHRPVGQKHSESPSRPA